MSLHPSNAEVFYPVTTTLLLVYQSDCQIKLIRRIDTKNKPDYMLLANRYLKFVRSCVPGALRLSNQPTQSTFGLVLQIFRQAGPPQCVNCFPG